MLSSMVLSGGAVEPVRRWHAPPQGLRCGARAASGQPGEAAWRGACVRAPPLRRRRRCWRRAVEPAAQDSAGVRRATGAPGGQPAAQNSPGARRARGEGPQASRGGWAARAPARLLLGASASAWRLLAGAAPARAASLEPCEAAAMRDRRPGGLNATQIPAGRWEGRTAARGSPGFKVSKG